MILSQEFRNIFFVMLFALFGTVSCNPQKNGHEKGKAYEHLDQVIGSDCTLYITYLFEGDFMYRVDLMDSCNNLTKSDYVNNYSSLLSKNIERIPLKRGKILFQTYFDISTDSSFKQKLIHITEQNFKATSNIIDESNPDRFTIILK